jgi:integrase/recombinase XerD
MFEHYFTKPDTIDHIRACWLGDAIERHIIQIAAHGYGARSVYRRVPILRRFAEFSWQAGARSHGDLPAQVAPFVTSWLANANTQRSADRRRELGNEVRAPIEHFLSHVLPDFVRRGRQPWKAPEPFATAAPGFFGYLREERGLQETSVRQYRHFLLRLERYLARLELDSLAALSPSVLSAFITESSRERSPNAMTGCCSSIRVFVRYLHREGLVARDLALTIGTPQKYRLSNVPRSISWEEVQRMLDAVDQRTATGKRDYVILLLLVDQ